MKAADRVLTPEAILLLNESIGLPAETGLGSRTVAEYAARTGLSVGEVAGHLALVVALERNPARELSPEAPDPKREQKTHIVMEYRQARETYAFQFVFFLLMIVAFLFIANSMRRNFEADTAGMRGFPTFPNSFPAQPVQPSWR